MKVQVIGSSLFALKVMEKFAGSPFLQHCNVSLIGRSFSDSRGDRFCLDSLSRTYKCSLVTSGSQQSETLNLVQEFTPDVLFCLGWNYLLGQDVLKVARIASIGYHPSMLPQGRGRSPIIWAIVLGLPETGSSFFELAPEPDAGGIITQERVLIAKDETSSSLYAKLIQIGYTQFTQIIEQFLRHGKIVPLSQEELSATTWRKRDEKDGRIDFRMSALCIDRLVRALTWPYPNPTIPLEPEKGFLTVIESCPGTRAGSMNLEPGRIIAIDNYWVHVKAGADSTIWLKLAADSATSNFLLSKSAKLRYFLPCTG